MNKTNLAVAMRRVSILVAVMTFAVGLNAQQGIVSEPFALSGDRSLSLSTAESWDGRSTHIGVDIILTETSKAPRTIHRLELVKTPFDLRTSPHDGVYPSIRSAEEADNQIAMLLGVMALGTTEDGHYLILDKIGDSFQVVNALELDGLLPSRRSSNPQQPLELKISKLRQIHVVHHDQFGVNIDIAPDNSVTINGKPCAPKNAPIKRLQYRQFLNALSPTTAQTYDVPLRSPRAISWWTNPTISPPFSLAAYMELSELITWSSQPAIDPATIPTSPKADSQNTTKPSAPPSVKPIPVPKAVEAKPAAPSGEPAASTPWSVVAVLIVAATGLLWLLVKKRK